VAVKIPDLGQMVGPLPLGGWVAVVGGGLGLAYVARRRGDGGDEEEVIIPEVAPFPSTPATSGPRLLSPALPAEPSAPPITDNGEWVSLAIRALVTKGYSPYQTQQCLQRFLEGVIQGEPCASIVSAAIQAVGPPPNPAPVNQFPVNPLPPAPSPRQPTQPRPPSSPNVTKLRLCRTYSFRPSGAATWTLTDRAGYDARANVSGSRSTLVRRGGTAGVEYHPCGRPNESRPKAQWVPVERYTFTE
jgi:hypothetical protein